VHSKKASQHLQRLEDSRQENCPTVTIAPQCHGVVAAEQRTSQENAHHIIPNRDVSEGVDDGIFQQVGVLSCTAESEKQRQEAQARAQEALAQAASNREGRQGAEEL